MGWQRRVRYFRERLPGYGVVLNSVDGGDDAPLTQREDRRVALIVLAVVAMPALLVAVAFGFFALLR